MEDQRCLAGDVSGSEIRHGMEQVQSFDNDFRESRFAAVGERKRFHEFTARTGRALKGMLQIRDRPPAPARCERRNGAGIDEAEVVRPRGIFAEKRQEFIGVGGGAGGFASPEIFQPPGHGFQAADQVEPGRKQIVERVRPPQRGFVNRLFPDRHDRRTGGREYRNDRIDQRVRKYVPPRGLDRNEVRQAAGAECFAE